MSRGGTKNISTSELLHTCDTLFVTRFTTEQERVDDHHEVERLYDASFGGSARWQRPIYDLRRGHSPVAALCQVVRQHEQEAGGAGGAGDAEQAHPGRIVAALRFWEVRIKESRSGTTASSRKKQQGRQTEKRVLLFGPLAVYAEVQGKGLGKALVERNIAEATRLGYGGILISGVAAYYRPFGFRTLCVEGLRMPKPSPGHALMGLELKLHFLISAKGEVLPEERNVCRS